ncbi:MAG: UDP-3-O-(3-hydroxymyristoyl)glucosamine N-acyltransferase [Bryobacterales bacterium]|nr:UDP-3-O-(3-hydroxymyristoyl)glucosamine N-acyltransferase [Bryobacterales bacterium]
MTAITVRELAALLDAPFTGDPELPLTAVAAAGAAGPHDVAFASNAKVAAASPAGCLLTNLDLAPRTAIRVADPRAAFARVVARFHPIQRPAPGIHPTAVVDPTATLQDGVSVGPHAVIGPDCHIGARTVISAACVLGSGVTIGPDSWLHPRVTIYDATTVGARAILHSGCILGADGFGFAMTAGRWEKFPQVGRVELGDDVEIGANACVDRAALGLTRIGDGTKLDNMVHVGHNCSIGRHVVVAAQTGFSGGVSIGDYAVVGGQVGVGDKARIESKAIVGSGAGILTSKIVRAGEPVWGTPARPLREYLETLAAAAKTPQLRRQVRDLAQRLELLEKRLS